MTFSFLYDENGTLIRERLISVEPQEINVEIHSDEVKLVNREECGIFSVSSYSYILPSILLKEDDYTFIQKMALTNNSKSIVLAINVDKKTLKIRKYNLSDRRFVQEWQAEGEVNYIFTDGIKVLTNPINSWNFFSINYLDIFQQESVFFKHTKHIVSWSVLESQNLIASSGKDNLVKIWNIHNGDCLETIVLDDYAENIQLLNSNFVIGWQSLPRLWAWNLDNHQFILQENGLYPSVVKFNADNQSIFVGTRDGKLACYSLINGQLNWITQVYNTYVDNLEFFPDISAVIVCGNGGKIGILDANSGEIKKILLGHKHNGHDLIKLKDNGLIIKGRDANIRIWDIETGHCLALLSGHIHLIAEILITYDNQYLVSRDQTNRVILWKADWNNLIKNLR